MKHQGRVIQNILKDKGYTLAEIAERGGFNQNYYYTVLKNEKLTMKQLRSIAKGFDIELDLFIEMIENYGNESNEPEPAYETTKRKYDALLEKQLADKEEKVELLKQIIKLKDDLLECRTALIEKQNVMLNEPKKKTGESVQ